MQRQRGELVPIGEVVSGLDGPVRALRETPPPARRGFTVADQVNQLVGASEADPNLGFMGRTMALCSLPRSNPGNRKEYKRVNGPFTLYIVAGGGNKLPFGNLPRLLLAWVSTEAVRTQSRELVLGRSLVSISTCGWSTAPSRSATALLEAGVPPVRSTPGQRPRQENRSKLPHQGAARIEEDQDGLAGPELHHGSGRPDPASFNPRHRPSGSVSTSKLEPQGSPLDLHGAVLRPLRTLGDDP